MVIKQSGLSVPLCKASRCVFPQRTCFVAQPFQRGKKKPQKPKGFFCWNIALLVFFFFLPVIYCNENVFLDILLEILHSVL